MSVLSLESIEEIKVEGRSNIFIDKGSFDWAILSVCRKIMENGKIPIMVFSKQKNFRKFVDENENEFQIQIPPLDVLPFEPVKASINTLKNRIKFLIKLSENKLDEKLTIMTTLPMLLQRVISPEAVYKNSVEVETGKKINQKLFVEKLTEIGYERVFKVVEPGQFSVKGFITDVFSLNCDRPVRIELFDDEIEEIREFDADSQQSVSKLKKFRIAPAMEMILNDDNLGKFTKKISSLMKKYPSEDFLRLLEDNFRDYGALSPLFMDECNALIQNFNDRYVLVFQDLLEGLENLRNYEKELFELYPSPVYRELYFRYLRIGESSLPNHKNWVNLISDAAAQFSSGFIKDVKTFKLKETGRISLKKERYRSKFIEYPTQMVSGWEELEKGELVVHEDYGVGRFVGNEVISNFSGTKEYLKLKYDGDVDIFVPVESIDRVHKYIGNSELVKLTNLKKKNWSAVKQKVKEDIERKVEELLEIYAARSKTVKNPLKGDFEMESKFIDSFPHIETLAQLKAIEDVCKDMEKEIPMDRLVFGDAGSGKTEVAMRAAFRCVVSGYQVAMMAPTTVLARQHYENIDERMKPFGVNVELIDRFVTDKKKKEIYSSVKTGNTDVLIGTHSILSKNMKFKNLGLLIIDEEQKFGVAQKEKMKKYRENIDVLTLSATPIPRTLYMGISGIKEMSVIDMMPPGRIPVEVISAPLSEKLVKTGILREITRGGQVIFVHNRVQDIEEVFHELKKIIPGVSIGMAHGQMKKSVFEKVVAGFYDGKMDVLLCTTIIESGVDIPNANTLIIDDSFRYGVSQLYQLRGRVGRSNRRAFAYFLYPNESLTPEANERLKAIEQFNGAGSGLQLSMRDMEIRGMGNVLGFEQHGSINTIGLHLYQQMLDEVMVRSGLKQEIDEENVEEQVLKTELKGFNFDVMIPEDYVDNNVERMKIYRKIAVSRTLESIDSVEFELRDRFGKVPGSVKKLLMYSKIRIMSDSLGILRLERNEKNCQICLFFGDIRDIDSFGFYKKRGHISMENLEAILMDLDEWGLYEVIFRNYEKKRKKNG